MPRPAAGEINTFTETKRGEREYWRRTADRLTRSQGTKGESEEQSEEGIRAVCQAAIFAVLLLSRTTRGQQMILETGNTLLVDPLL